MMGLLRGASGVVLALAWGHAALAEASPEDVMRLNTRLMLELVRHTPTYSPPVASRTFAYAGIAAYEALASSSGDLVTLSGQLNGLTAPPLREADAVYDEAAILQASYAAMLAHHFANTGPTGQRAMAAVAARLAADVSEGLDAAVLERSLAHGRAIAAHVIAWGEGDGGAVIENMGFPAEFTLASGPSAWVPTSRIVQQQMPLLPAWGSNRTIAMPDGAACPVVDPLAYSEQPGSPFYDEAVEVAEIRANLTPEQRAVARFWSDDPMLSPTPPGHWISIAAQVLDAEGADAPRRAEVMALLGIALSDAFVACWHEKFVHNLVRPVTYIRAQIDPAFEPLLITPPFPEYPSGHSTQSAAAAAVLTSFFGEDYAFVDATHEGDGLPGRAFPSFMAAAEEAALSRLYGGIHFRHGLEEGLTQGLCVGAHVTALRTRL